MYDFDAQPGTGELSINAGDILTVTRTDVGDGWWEGSNTRGESGLFPEAYVEVRKKSYLLIVTQRVSNSRARDRLGFSQSGSGLGSVCTLASGSAGFGFLSGFYT